MDLRTTLLVEHSKAQTMKVVDYIGDNQERFDDLIELFLSDEYRVSQRSAMAVGHVYDQHPHLLQPHLKRIVENLRDNTVHDAIKRNTVRVLQGVDLPEELLGLTADICFTYLDDPKTAVAIRAFSMTVLFNICQKEPDLANELQLVIEEHIEHGTAGFKSRGRKILKALKNLQRL